MSRAHAGERLFRGTSDDWCGRLEGSGKGNDHSVIIYQSNKYILIDSFGVRDYFGLTVILCDGMGGREATSEREPDYKRGVLVMERENRTMRVRRRMVGQGVVL